MDMKTNLFIKFVKGVGTRAHWVISHPQISSGTPSASSWVLANVLSISGDPFTHVVIGSHPFRVSGGSDRADG